MSLPPPPAAAQRGQASVELVTLMPLAAAIVLAAWQGVLLAWAAVSAEHAARAGARAALTGRPAAGAVRHALPEGMRAGLRTDTRGGRVRVVVRAPSVIPGFSPTLSASAAVVRQ
ncbi:MAG: TadE/TadG family type IV pilus assembly protein [Gaiellales bacterium]